MVVALALICAYLAIPLVIAFDGSATSIDKDTFEVNGNGDDVNISISNHRSI